jgi:hypothetical protein
MDRIDFRCSYCKLQVLYIFVNVRIIDLDKYHDCVDPPRSHYLSNKSQIITITCTVHASCLIICWFQLLFVIMVKLWWIFLLVAFLVLGFALIVYFWHMHIDQLIQQLNLSINPSV